MRRLFAISAALASLLAPAAAGAQSIVTSERPDAVAIVVYPELYGRGLVMITETRQVDLPAGPVTIRFQGVADQVVAQTVALEGLPRGVAEQNFDYQLLTPGALIRASEGRMVSLVRTNPETGAVTREPARVVSGQNGAILDIGGRIEALDCAAMPERLVFNDLPGGFVAEPTLSADLVSPQAGTATLRLSYLATGVSWQANYVGRLAPDGEAMEFSAWITIENGSDTSFTDAPVQVIAGQLQRRPNETRPVSPRRIFFRDNCWEIDSGRYVELQAFDGFASGGTINFRNAGPPMEMAMAAPPPPPPPPPAAPPAPEDLGDYKLYTLGEPTTVAAHQTKQLALFFPRRVEVERVLRQTFSSVYSAFSTRPIAAVGDAPPIPVREVIETENEEEAGLGLPLPSGDVAIFTEQDGVPILLGQPDLNDTAIGLPVRLEVGAVANVQTQSRVVRTWREGKGNDQIFRAEIETLVTNALSRPVTVEIREVAAARSLRTLSESLPHTRADGFLRWSAPVAANGETTLTYVLEWRP